MSPPTSVGIIGNGVVGNALGHSLKNCRLFVHDTDASRTGHTLDAVLENSDITFVCLPSPRDSFLGGVSVDVLNSFFESVQGNQRNLLVIKSTVPVGYTEGVKRSHGIRYLLHSPEFLTERTAVTDAAHPRQLLIGIPGGSNVSPCCSHLLKSFYEAQYPGVPISISGSNETEAAKLFSNAFFATKIAFFNQLHQACNCIGMDYETVLGHMLLDGRIHPEHVDVPGPDGQLGFGGKCLPKDAEEAHLLLTGLMIPTFLGDVLRRNEYDRKGRQ